MSIGGSKTQDPVRLDREAAPAVSVLMTVRDARDTIDECLDSISAQTWKDYELIVVDDGSSDDSAQRIAKRSAHDARIRLFKRSRRGLVPTVNEGLARCLAPLVARMDADDRMHPERLERQLAFFKRHPDIDVAGSRVYAFPESKLGPGMREYLRWQNGCLTPDAIAADIYLESPLTQSSVMFRRDAVTALGGYRDGNFPEDYDLWLRLVQSGKRVGKCPETLLEWRQRDDSYSRIDARFSREAFDRLRASYLAQDPRLGLRRELAIWGAGRVTRKRCRHLLQRGFRPTAWIDIDAKKIGGKIDGVEVVAPDWLKRRSGDKAFVLVYVASHGAREAIAESLQAMRFERGRDYLFVG